MIEARLLEGTLVGVTYSNADTGYVVARLEVGDRTKPVTVVGNLWGANLGETVRLKGTWVRHARYGDQFKVTEYESLLPASTAAIERYLASGLIKGIGPVYAKRLVEAFGAETLRVIEAEPERLLAVGGIGETRLRRIRAAWDEQRQLRGLVLFLQEHQLSPTFALRIYKAYGPQAPQRIREDPYRLAREIVGIGFKTADRIGASLGFAKDAPKRLAAGLLYLLHEATEAGHVYYPASRLFQEAGELLEVDREVLLQQALSDLHKENVAVCETLDGDTAVYLAPLRQAEEGVSRRLVSLASAPRVGLSIDPPLAVEWAEARGEIRFTSEQREALKEKVPLPLTEQIYRIRSAVDIPAQKDIFFHGDDFRATGEAEFTGTFHLFGCFECGATCCPTCAACGARPRRARSSCRRTVATPGGS